MKEIVCEVYIAMFKNGQKQFGVILRCEDEVLSINESQSLYGISRLINTEATINDGGMTKVEFPEERVVITQHGDARIITRHLPLDSSQKEEFWQKLLQ